MSKNAIFIAATGQNVGKTTLCLGIIAGLQKRFREIGFIKPVGQQHVSVGPDLNVDKDVVLFKEHFQLTTRYEDMSPVILPSGFTKDYLDGKIQETEIQHKIDRAFQHVYRSNHYTVVEGTGHVGVGSIINMNNAQVAARLGLDMIIIASGGLGAAHDEIALNMAMCQLYGVKIRGVILNRVVDHKREMIKEYFPKALKHWKIPLIGCIPYNEFLSMPAMEDFEILFNTPLLKGEKHRLRHFRHQRLVSGSLENYQHDMFHNELVITPTSREDIIFATLEKHIESLKNEKRDFEGGLILTGRRPPSKEVLQRIQTVDIPVLYAPICSYDAMKMITSFTAKIRNEDVTKVEKAIKIVEENIDFDLLCQEKSHIEHYFSRKF